MNELDEFVHATTKNGLFFSTRLRSSMRDCEACGAEHVSEFDLNWPSVKRPSETLPDSTVTGRLTFASRRASRSTASLQCQLAGETASPLSLRAIAYARPAQRPIRPADRPEKCSGNSAISGNFWHEAWPSCSNKWGHFWGLKFKHERLCLPSGPSESARCK